MFTVQLWKALRTPSQHTLFRYFRASVLSQKTVVQIIDEMINSRFIFEMLTIVLVIGGCIFACFLSVYLFALVPLFIPLVGTYFALNNALKIGNMLTHEHRTQRYALLSISPVGISGIHWFIASIVCMTNNSIKQVTNIVRIIFILMFFGAGMVLFQQTAMNLNNDPIGTFGKNLLLLFPFFLLMGIITLDFFQSNVLGCIIGMFIPLYLHKEIEAAGLILGVFLLAQILFYLVVGIVVYVLVANNVIDLLEKFEQSLLIGSIALIVLFVIRELLIMQLWRYLVEALETDMSEFKHLMEKST